MEEILDNKQDLNFYLDLVFLPCSLIDLIYMYSAPLKSYHMLLMCQKSQTYIESSIEHIFLGSNLKDVIRFILTKYNYKEQFLMPVPGKIVLPRLKSQFYSNLTSQELEEFLNIKSYFSGFPVMSKLFKCAQEIYNNNTELLLLDMKTLQDQISHSFTQENQIYFGFFDMNRLRVRYEHLLWSERYDCVDIYRNQSLKLIPCDFLN
jgi:hypothetical protein